MNKLMAAPLLLWLAACGPKPESAAPEAQAAASSSAAPATPSLTATASGDAASASAPAASPATSAEDDPTAVNQAIDEALGDHARYEQVIRQLQQAVAAGDKQAVAALVDYPFATVRDGRPLKIADAAQFVREYDAIVTPKIAQAIAGQKYSQLMVNYKGVMFGSGEAWVNGICKDNACKEFDVRVVALQPGT